MQQYDPKTWFGLIFHKYSRSVLKTLRPLLIVVAVYTSAITFVIMEYFEVPLKTTTQVHSILGIVLGLFLVFRINSAYERWWEGRSRWGLLVNDTRNLAQKFSAMLPPEQESHRRFFRMMISNFPFALKEHLREGTKIDELEDPGDGSFELIKNAVNVPNVILSLMYNKTQSLLDGGIINGQQMIVLDTELHEFTGIQGACERIKNTPIPYSYSMYIKKFIFIFVLTLPFGFVTSFGYVTIPAVLLLFYILVSIELIAEEIEDPFGTDVNDLPTDELSEKIRNDIAEIFGVTENQRIKTLETNKV